MTSVHTSSSIFAVVTALTATALIALGAVLTVVSGTIGLVLVAVGLLDAVAAAVVFGRLRARAARDSAAAIPPSGGNALR